MADEKRCEKKRRVGSSGRRVSAPLRTLLVDNYDSYTYNLYQLIHAVTGVEPLVVRNDDAKLAFGVDGIPDIFSSIDCIVISPGPGTAETDSDIGACGDIVKHMTDIPILGVCLGHQCIASVHGARIVRGARPCHGIISSLTTAPASCKHGSIFNGMPETFKVVRYHSLVVDTAAELPSSLVATAWTDEKKTIMALQHRTRPLWGVQFHPESICTEYGAELMANFLLCAEACLQPHARPHLCSLGPAGTTTREQLAQSQSHPSVARLRILRCPGGANRVGDATDLFERIFGAAKSPFCYFLDSSNHRSAASCTASRFSFMGDGARIVECYGGEKPTLPELRFWAYDKNAGAKRFRNEHISARAANAQGDIFVYLKSEVEFYRDATRAQFVDVTALDEWRSEDAWNIRETSSKGIPFEYLCGYMGVFGYELRGLCEPNPQRGGARPRDESVENSLPDASFILSDRCIVMDHYTGDAFVMVWSLSPEHVQTAAEPRPRAWTEASSAWMRLVHENIMGSDGAHVDKTDANTPSPLRPRELSFKPDRSRKQYVKNVESCISSIVDGETYEVCLTNQISSQHSCAYGETFALYKSLRQASPAPFAVFLAVDPSGSVGWMPPSARSHGLSSFAVCSSSPERFLRVSRERVVESKPIKGTARRGRTMSEDFRIASYLEASEKDRAENLMIVDLVRNDFGKVAIAGSVSVPGIFQVETYANVHQLVSTVRATLKPECSSVDAVRASFPGGSMTGAPKLRTMDIIDTLEVQRRGFYSGAVGYVSINDTVDLNIVIRTAVVRPGTISFGSGGAVIALSDPEAEYDEMLLKINLLAAALGGKVGVY